MSPVSDNPVILPERELEEEKKPGASEPPRIRCPLCGWSPRKEDKWFCNCGNEWNTTSGIWFTDIFTLLENRTAVRRRRGEQKDAGYYKPSAFKRIEEFPSRLATRHYEQLTLRLLEKPLEMI